MVSKKQKKEKFSKQKKTQKKKKTRNSNIQKIIRICNDVLIDNEKACNCFDKDGLPTEKMRSCRYKKNSKKCEGYNVCKKLFSSFMSGSEPKYDPKKWNEPLVNNSHNCYAYFLDDEIDVVKKKCKKKKNVNCGTLKPQPGHFSFLKGLRKSKRNKYTCPKMIKAVLDDNKMIEMSKFEKKCKKGYYKGFMVVDKDHTYHFYRQDSNGMWSHKQGTMDIENVDASGNPIFAPHLADKNYDKDGDDDDGINYTQLCGYMCVPSNKYYETNAI